MLQGKPCIRVATKHLNIKTLLIFTIFSFILLKQYDISLQKDHRSLFI